MSMPPSGSGGDPLVYVVGDSISIQYGPHLEAALAGRCRYARKSGEAEAQLNLDVPLGANAGDSVRVVEFLTALLADPGFRPALLVVNCGLHDIKRYPPSGRLQVPPDRYADNLRAIIGLCRHHGVRLVWVRSTPVVTAIHNARSATFFRTSEDLDTINRCADAVMAQAGVPTIDLHSFTCGLGPVEELFCDHVHFTEVVRERQGRFLAETLLAMLPDRPLADEFPPVPGPKAPVMPR